MIKKKEQPKKRVKKVEELKPLQYEVIRKDGVDFEKLTYPDGKVEYREV